MITFGKRRGGNGKKSRSTTRFPRGAKVLKNYEGTHLPMGKPFGWWKGYTVTAEKMKRFLLSNVGRPVDKVYSEFLKRCDKNIFDPEHTFYKYIERKEDIPYWGGFYVTNGILNYKKRKKPAKYVPNPTYKEFNAKNMPPKDDLISLCDKTYGVRDAVYLGQFYVAETPRGGCKLKSVFLFPIGDKANPWPFRSVDLAGFGTGFEIYKDYSDFLIPKKKVRFLQGWQMHNSMGACLFVTK